MRKLVVAISALSILFAAPAFAATKPAKATLNEATQKVTFSGNVDFPANVFNQVVDGCSGPDASFCDHFALKVDTAGSVAGYDVVINLPVAADQDLDLYVYDAKGKQVGVSGNNPGVKERVILKAPKNGVYDVAISGFLGVDSAYKGTAELKKPVK
jgi:hypothetical protein